MLPSTNRSSSNPPVISLSQITPYFPRHAAWPYSSRDFTRSDEASDSDFYTQPRFVAHIDDPAISRLTAYYGTVIPRTGRVLDFCTAWNSWYPDVITDAVNRGDVEVYGLGMNAKELAKNQLLCGFSDRSAAVDLNVAPHSISAGWSSNHGDGQTVPKFDCATCTVSIDYLTEPVKVLESVRKHMSDGGTVHLIISNRCFPTKAVRIWLELDTNERLQLVGDFLHFAGWKDIEIVDLCARDERGEKVTDRNGRMLKGQGVLGFLGLQHMDPLWVVRGTKRD